MEAGNDVNSTEMLVDTEAEISDAEIAGAIAVLRRLIDASGAPTPTYSLPRLKGLRTALLPFVDEARGRLFRGQNAESFRQGKTSRKDRAVRLASELARDRKTIDKTRLRAERLVKLKQLEQASGFARVPDGPVDDGAVPLLLTGGGALGEVAAGSAEGAAAPATDADADAAEPRALLASSRVCYACKARFELLHHFYDQLCPPCAALNFEKRHASADLRGRVALVTGARIKIGYCICLKLLRAGCAVIATTRFPHDAALRFWQAADFSEWGARLQLVGIDLRDLAAVERLCDHLAADAGRLDIIVNNACQTVRRPPAYYAHLIGRELQPVSALPAEVRLLLRANAQATGAGYLHRVRGLRAAADAPIALLGGGGEGGGGAGGGDAGGDAGGRGGRTAGGSHHGEGSGSGGGGAADLAGGGPAAGPPAEVPAARARGGASIPSALLSQLPLIDGDDARCAEPTRAQVGDGGAERAPLADCASDFPQGCADVNGQQLDLRARNSWTLRLDEVTTTEAAEVLAINSLAPFVLNSRLKPLMAHTARAHSSHAFIVNVSAMEGKFYRQKTKFHPHTNMAKAALNMMTRTSAADYAASAIFMTAVDTGWINDENPLEKALQTARERHFQTPLDEVDAAARVLDPVFDGVRTGAPVFGVFLKDYCESEW
jgi:NAD(P)-dependent dehydrogenase (short-subunit alcohol dehydrogenase family)